MALEDELAKLVRGSGGSRAPKSRTDTPRRGLFFGLAALAVLAAVAAAVAATGLARTGPNQVAVVYNGGPLDRKDQRQTIAPSSGLTWTGWLSQNPRTYPGEGSPRRYIVTTDSTRDEGAGVDVVRVPTADGIDVGLEAKISFNTAFTGTEEDALLRKFDASFGNRTYPLGGRRLNPWQEDDGFSAFLDVEFRPVMANVLRDTVGTFRCEQLVSSCALLGGSRRAKLEAAAGRQTNANLTRVQETIQEQLGEDLSQNLGGRYFDNFQVIVSSVRLPGRVQEAVDEAQAQFAAVNKSRADLERARIAKEVNDTLGRSYRNCPACAQIDALKAIPGNVNAISLGGNGAVSLQGR
ncbi:MAG: SPFH domain-containing protein [Actinomycetota bacterium]|nr:SPFH domain-containing protein [Actinomycetota bacterium]